MAVDKHRVGKMINVASESQMIVKYEYKSNIRSAIKGRPPHFVITWVTIWSQSQLPCTSNCTTYIFCCPPRLHVLSEVEAQLFWMTKDDPFLFLPNCVMQCGITPRKQLWYNLRTYSICTIYIKLPIEARTADVWPWAGVKMFQHFLLFLFFFSLFLRH